MSLALKQKNEINLFNSVVYHISLWTFLTLLIIRNAAIAINILIYVLGNTLSTFTKQFIMIAAERSASIAKSCLVLVEFLAVNYIKYIDFDDQKEKVTSEKNSIKTILSNASKRVQTPVKKDITGSIAAPKTPIVSAEILKKSEAARQIKPNPANKPTEAAPLSNFSVLSLRKAENEKLPIEQRYRSLIPSPLGNNSDKLKPVDYCPSKRYSTSSSEEPKRTMTMKFINSTAANRVMKRKKQRQEEDDEEEYEEDIKVKQQQKSTTKQKPDELNLNLFDERPTISKPSRTRLNKSPEAHLQVARRYLKVMIRVKKHRNTI